MTSLLDWEWQESKTTCDTRNITAAIWGEIQSAAPTVLSKMFAIISRSKSSNFRKRKLSTGIKNLQGVRQTGIYYGHNYKCYPDFLLDDFFERGIYVRMKHNS